MPRDDQWKRQCRNLQNCPIKNVCKEARAAYTRMLGRLQPICLLATHFNFTKSEFEEWAPVDGSISELFLSVSPWKFLRSMSEWRLTEGRLRGLKTIYFDPHGFLAMSGEPWVPPRFLTTSANYYQVEKIAAGNDASQECRDAIKKGLLEVYKLLARNWASSSQTPSSIVTDTKSLHGRRLRVTPISPSATNLYESMLFLPNACSSHPIHSRIWVECAQMIRKPNGDLVFVFSADMPWVIGKMQVEFLFMHLGRQFNELPHLERIVFVKEIVDIETGVFCPATRP